MLGGRLAVDAFCSQECTHLHCARGYSTQSSSVLYNKKQSSDDFWDEKFKGDADITPSDRMKRLNSDIESIDEQLKELDALAAEGRPTIPGDYDWDEAYKDDPNWITGDQVPGKMKFTNEQLQAQQDALDALASKWTSDGYETSESPPEEVSEST